MPLHHIMLYHSITYYVRLLLCYLVLQEPGLTMMLRSAEAAGVPVWVRGADATELRSWGHSEKGEVLPRGVGTLRCLFILSENSACQVPSCAVAA